MQVFLIKNPDMMKSFLTIVISIALSLNSIITYSQENLILNGDFSQGETEWDLYNGPAEASFQVEDGVAVIEINNPGDNDWEPQLSQDEFAMQQNVEYRIRFQARSDEARSIIFGVSTGPDTYIPFIKQRIQLEQDVMYEYDFTFHALNSDENARLEFNCGQNPSNVYIDNVSLVETGGGGGTSTYVVSGKIYDAAGGDLTELYPEDRISIRIVISGDMEMIVPATPFEGSFQYEFDLEENLSASIVPQMDYGYTVTPDTIYINNISADQPDKDFAALPEGGSLEKYNVSGTVTRCGEPLENVTITYNDNSVMTDASGSYTIEVTGAGVATLIPVLDGYSFVPEIIEFYNLTEDKTGQNFNAVSETANVLSGTVFNEESGIPYEGATVNLQIGNEDGNSNNEQTVLTDADGNYTFNIDRDLNNSENMKITTLIDGFDVDPEMYVLSTNDVCNFEDNDFMIKLLAPEICMVGVDESNNNMVVWEKMNTDIIDDYNVYRETSTAGEFELIGTVPYSSSGVFVDESSNPAVQSFSYKISAMTSHDYETDKSLTHKTIHLTINQGIENAWNLIWNAYGGLNVSTYKLYRGSEPENMAFLTDIAGNLDSYSDLDPPDGLSYYQIEVLLPEVCDPDGTSGVKKSLSREYASTRSNIVNSGQVSGSSDQRFVDGFVLYPNPANKHLHIRNFQTLASYEIINLQGVRKSAGRLDKNVIDISGLASGFYIIRLIGIEGAGHVNSFIKHAQ